VSAAANLAEALPATAIDLYYPGERALPQHHRSVWRRMRGQAHRSGSGTAPRTPAVVADAHEDITAEPCSGAPANPRHRRCRAVGDRTGTTQHRLAACRITRRARIRPCDTAIAGNPTIRGYSPSRVSLPPIRCASARSRADGLLAATSRRTPPDSRCQLPAPKARWARCSVRRPWSAGVRPDRSGGAVPAWSVRNVVQPWIVKRGIYRGVRDP
jgi:hypothetical protein